MTKIYLLITLMQAPSSKPVLAFSSLKDACAGAGVVMQFQKPNAATTTSVLEINFSTGSPSMKLLTCP